MAAQPRGIQPLSAERDLVHLPVVTGREAWDTEYREGRWNVLRSPEEEMRYRVIAGCVLAPNPDVPKRVLDLGCGNGVLREYLAADCLELYTGVDWSEAAVAEARDRNHARSAFHSASILDWKPDKTYDTIVFNEVLYYLPRPADVVSRYSDHLRPNGSIVISMWCPAMFDGWRIPRPGIVRARLGCWRIWRELRHRYVQIGDGVVEWNSVRRWRIQALRCPPTA